MPFEENPDSPVAFPGISTGSPTPGEEITAPAMIVVPPASLPLRSTCRIVRQMIAEMNELVGERIQVRRDRRRTACHVRQIAMYVCHVALEIPMNDIGAAFGRDRTTVAHACEVVEDRRDDPAFDEFVSAVERISTSVFAPARITRHD